MSWRLCTFFILLVTDRKLYTCNVEGDYIMIQKLDSSFSLDNNHYLELGYISDATVIPRNHSQKLPK